MMFCVGECDGDNVGVVGVLLDCYDVNGTVEFIDGDMN